MNKAILIGNLTKDPDVRNTASGISACTFTVAVQRRYANTQGEREADFLNVVAWRQLAELCARFLTKGSKVCIEGTIQSRSYDAKDGTKRYVTEIVADNVEFLSAKAKEGTGGAEAAAKELAGGGLYGLTEVDDDELPF